MLILIFEIFVSFLRHSLLQSLYKTLWKKAPYFFTHITLLSKNANPHCITDEVCNVQQSKYTFGVYHGKSALVLIAALHEYTYLSSKSSFLKYWVRQILNGARRIQIEEAEALDMLKTHSTKGKQLTALLCAWTKEQTAIKVFALRMLQIVKLSPASIVLAHTAKERMLCRKYANHSGFKRRVIKRF